MSNIKEIKTREEAKEIILNALDDNNLDLMAFANHTLAEFGCICGGTSNIIVTNLDEFLPCNVSISKTCGKGDDGFFTIEGGKTESWSRCVFRRATITADSGEGPRSLEFTVGINTTNFTINGREIT